MGVNRRHTLYGIEVDSTLIGGIISQRVATGTEVQSEPTSGEVYPRFQAITAQKPTISFTTKAIAAVLNAIGLTGSNIGDLTAGLSAYAYKHAVGGTRAGAGNHRKYNAKHGLIVPQTLSVSHQEDATLPYEAAVTYDGQNDPIVITDNANLPAGLTDVERFTLGPIQIENITLPECTSLELDFGITVETKGAGSEIWDTFSSIGEIKPVLTLRGIDVEWFKSTNIPLAGKASSHANTTIYLRKRAQGQSFIGDGTAEHIKLTMAGLAHIDPPFDASGSEPAETSLIMPLRYDGTNDPVVINTASAIT